MVLWQRWAAAGLWGWRGGSGAFSGPPREGPSGGVGVSGQMSQLGSPTRLASVLAESARAEQVRRDTGWIVAETVGCGAARPPTVSGSQRAETCRAPRDGGTERIEYTRRRSSLDRNTGGAGASDAADWGGVLAPRCAGRWAIAKRFVIAGWCARQRAGDRRPTRWGRNGARHVGGSNGSEAAGKTGVSARGGSRGGGMGERGDVACASPTTQAGTGGDEGDDVR